MSATSRELVYQALNCEGPARAPRQLWYLPWAEMHHAEALAEMRAAFPDDIATAPGFLSEEPATQGDAYAIGQHTDPWGCVFESVQAGVIGEVKDPLIKDWARDTEKIHIPREWLRIDGEQVNRFCGATECFVLSGCCPRPFERMQFLRGSADFYMDLMMRPPEMMDFLEALHRFYCEWLEVWVKTAVDGVNFMDDWGSQQSLLIDPALWRELFKPMYRDYIQIAHGAGKRIFMHSDGFIRDIYPDLIELGLDAINSQIFCMGIEELAPFAGKICFWGEVDRQHILPEATVEEVREAVRRVHENLWRDGGCIAQCEFGPAAKPENVRAAFAAWDELSAG